MVITVLRTNGTIRIRINMSYWFWKDKRKL
jgi:hypothetical protein